MGLLNLRDKLLQAGLVTQEQAKKAEEDAKRKAEARRGPPNKGRRDEKREDRRERGPRPEPKPKRELTEAERIAAEEAAARREHEQFLAREREENRKRAVLDRQRQEKLRALALAHEIGERGEEAFHFVTRKNRVLRMYLTPEQIRRLEAGELAVIEKPLPAELSYSLVPREAAEEAVAIDVRAVRFYNRGNGETFGFKGEPPSATTEGEGDTADAPGEGRGEAPAAEASRAAPAAEAVESPETPPEEPTNEGSATA
jgi:uncharacterized protein YaiL (DUF2058 family)